MQPAFAILATGVLPDQRRKKEHSKREVTTLVIVMFLYMSICLFMVFFLSDASFNVNGLRQDLKRNVLFECLERKKYDIILLQETHSELNDEILWSNKWQGDMVFSHGNRLSRGFAAFT